MKNIPIIIKKHSFVFVLIIIFTCFSSKLFAGEFLNTFLHINLCASYGFIEGDIFNHEYDSYYIKDYEDKNQRPNHYAYSFGAFVDITPLPPLILGDESHAIKLGLRIAYRFHTIVQEIEYYATETDEDSLRENYIVYETPMIGLVLRYAPSIKPSSLHGDYLAGGGLTFFALYGKIRDGKLYSYPLMRSKDPENTILAETNAKETKLTGYRIEYGIGGEVSICSINLGMNVSYSVTHFTMDNQLYSSISKKSSFNQWGVEIYLSLPFEWAHNKRFF